MEYKLSIVGHSTRTIETKTRMLFSVGAKSIARSNDFSYIGPTSIIQKETGGVQPNKEFLTFFNMASD